MAQKTTIFMGEVHWGEGDGKEGLKTFGSDRAFPFLSQYGRTPQLSGSMLQPICLECGGIIR